MQPASTGRFSATLMLALLLAAYVLSFVDRTVMAVLIGPIRADFAIDDFQYSLLHGPAFTFFYVILGLPIARLADARSRRTVVAAGVFFWSLMTCCCGLARGFASLFVLRMGVGVGEAALSPPAHSLLADSFSARRLPLALAVYSLGIPLGSGLAFVIGGWVYGYFAAGGSIDLPFLASLNAWQLTFVAVGAPGFLVALAIACLREPARKGIVIADGHSGTMPVRAVIGFMWQRRALFGAPFIGLSLLSMLGYATLTWYLEFMVRRFGVERGVIGPQFGMLFIVAGCLGTLLGGVAAAWLEQRGYRDANFRLITLVALFWTVPAIAAPLMPSAELALWAAVPSLFFFNFHFGPALAGLQLITPNRMRAQASAALLFMTNVAGLGLGPVVIGFFTTYLFGDEQALHLALSLLALLVCPLAALVSGRGLRHYRAALAAA